MSLEEIKTDCRSEEGVTIGLIDSLISIARVLAKRDLNATRQIKEALKDLASDEDIDFVLASKLETHAERNRIEGVFIGLKICKEMFAQGTICHEDIKENEIYYTEELNNL